MIIGSSLPRCPRKEGRLEGKDGLNDGRGNEGRKKQRKQGCILRESECGLRVVKLELAAIQAATSHPSRPINFI